MTLAKAKAKINQLEKALASFKKGILEKPSDIERDGAIQRFEYSFELSWKTLKTVLEYLGIEDCKSPRKALQAGLIQGLINAKNQEVWLKMLDDRNETTHIYHEEVAVSIFSHLLDYYQLMLALKNKLKKELE
ncbi:MAG: nucleotidyltransferase substrate binding protein [Cyclobacteriaceae bacterium]|nr:nucleotidyltransferase substrate binding protein [Cyclobacteriaceae bacterium]